MQHKIYWGPLRKPLEWTLKTVAAPWAYIASVVYHDSFWYPTHQNVVHGILHSEWGRLFHNWDKVAIPADDLKTPGWANVGEDPVKLKKDSLRLLRQSIRILGTCIKEAPEFQARKRRLKAK